VVCQKLRKETKCGLPETAEGNSLRKEKQVNGEQADNRECQRQPYLTIVELRSEDINQRIKRKLQPWMLVENYREVYVVVCCICTYAC